MRTVLSVCAALVTLALVVLSAVLGARDGTAGIYLALVPIPALAFAVVALIGARRHRGGRDAILLHAFALSWSFSGFSNQHAWVGIQNAAIYLADLPPLFLAHMLFGIPGGRIRSGLDKALLAWSYLMVLLLSPMQAVIDNGLGDGCWTCFHGTGWALDTSVAFSHTYTVVFDTLSYSTLIAIITRLVVRVRSLSETGRRYAGPMMTAAVAVACGYLVSVIYTMSSGAHTVDETLPWWSTVLLVLTILTYPVAAGAFLVVLVRANLSATKLGRLLPQIAASTEIAEIEGMLRQSLGDPSATLAFGDEVAEHDLPGRASTEVRFGDRVVAVLHHDEILLEHPVAVEAAVSALGLLLGRRQLEIDAAEQEARLRATFAAAEKQGESARRRLNRDVARLQAAFGAYVDPSLAARITAGESHFDGTERDVSVLFLDLRNFTSYAETATPVEVVDRLNRLWSVVVPIVVEHGGHANKFMGDGMLAVFGAPEELVDHANAAVQAARDITRAVRMAFPPEVSTSIGVHTGTVVAGTIGGGGRVEFSVLGDVVNTASRIESATRLTDDPILISEATAQRLNTEHHQLQLRQPQVLKGKSKPVSLYAVAE